MSDAVAVRTLVGKKTLATSLVCLRSMMSAVVEPVRLLIHEDGTLDDTDRDALRQVGACVEMVTREAIDERVRSALARYPLSFAARETNMMFLKLFDTSLLAGPRLAYCDSDILFVRRVRGLFAPPSPTARLTFMADIKHAYSLRPWKLWPVGPVRLTGRLCAGLYVWDRPALDLDFVEWLLGRLAKDRGFITRPIWAEQTVWAALAAKTSTWLWDERQIVMADKTMTRPGPQTVAIHFVATFRNHLAAFQDRPLDSSPPTTVSASPARRLTAFGMFRSDAMARLGWQPF
jgi:hypothetical protein